jgi:hypothetical protein
VFASRESGHARASTVSMTSAASAAHWRTQMNSIIDLAGVGGAIAVSIALAVGLEWLSLRGLMLLMPGKSAPLAMTEEVAVQPPAERKAA